MSQLLHECGYSGYSSSGYGNPLLSINPRDPQDIRDAYAKLVRILQGIEDGEEDADKSRYELEYPGKKFMAGRYSLSDVVSMFGTLSSTITVHEEYLASKKETVSPSVAKISRKLQMLAANFGSTLLDALGEGEKTEGDSDG